MATITINASKDASALQTNDGWSGWDNHHPVGEGLTGHRYRSFVYFPISFTGMTGITSATLRLRAHRAGSGNHVLGSSSGGPPRNLAVHRMLRDWGEGTDRGETLWSSNETWGYENRAATASGSWSDSANSTATLLFNGYTDGTWYEVDVTSIVTIWFNGQPNYGVILKINDSTDENDTDAALEFYARDAGSGFKPQLVIEYTTNVAPNAPTGLSPTGDALVNTLTPTLTGTRSDDDSGDYVTASQILLYEDNGTTLKWDSGTLTQTGTSSTFSKVYSGPALIGNTFYKWKARTRDKGSSWGPYSSLQRFEVNSIPNSPTVSLTETPTSDILTLTPTMNITHSDNDATDYNMYGYHIILETAAGVSVWDSGDVDTTSTPAVTKNIVYSGPALSWRTIYRWRAKTKDQNGVWGPYSGWASFTTHSTLPPDTLAPSGGTAISGLVPQFWGRRGTTLDTIVSYQILLYENDAVTLLWDSGVLTTGISGGETFIKDYTGTSLSYGQTYRWKVRATGSIGGTSDYSPLQNFVTPTDATIPTQSISPVTAGRVTSLTPTFGGTRTSAAFTNYQIQLYPSTSTDSALGTAIWDSGNLSQASSTSFSKVYDGGTALEWNTSYKWRARVGAPSLGTYTGLSQFTTDAAGAPTLSSPINHAWLTDSTPDFTGTSPDSIVGKRVRVLDSVTFAVLWDSGVVAQAASGSWSLTYSGPTLTPGVSYAWEAQLTKASGPISPWSSRELFRLNGPPYIPTELEPTPGYAYADEVTPIFRAFFNDPEKNSHGDTPTEWTIEIRNNDTDALIQEKVLTTGLNAALNSYTWGTNTGGADTALAFDVVYKWRTAFTDSKGDLGAYSSYQTFSSAEAPVVDITTPSNGSNISTTRPIIEWTYDDPADYPMMKYRVKAVRVSNSVQVYDSGERVSSAPSFQIPTGYLQVNGEEYQISVQAWNSLNVPSNIDVVNVDLALAAPPAIEGLSATVEEDRSSIVLDWDASTLASAFVTYVVYRREVSDSEWSMIGTRKPESNTKFTDYYAGQQKDYEYRVTVVKLITNEPDVESPDSDIVAAKLQSDVWYVVGRDRAEEHIFELPVTDENHTRPVQQESFEPLGTNRKVVVRGFVLGHEGSVQVLWDQEESSLARQQIQYLLYYAGPHILKNPFGDVFDVTFGSPDYQYANIGHLSVTLTYTEVGATSNPGVSPDEFLETIGAF